MFNITVVNSHLNVNTWLDSQTTLSYQVTKGSLIYCIAGLFKSNPAGNVNPQNLTQDSFSAVVTW